MPAPVRTCSLLVLALILPADRAQALCNIAAEGLSFGRIELSQGGETSARITVDCDEPAVFAVAPADDHRDEPRIMTGPSGGRVMYFVYRDPNHQLRWGAGGSGGEPIVGNGDSSGSTEIIIYARIPEQPAQPTGSYIDQVVVNVEF